MGFVMIMVLVAVVIAVIVGIMVNDSTVVVPKAEPVARAKRPRVSKTDIGALDFSKIHTQLKSRKGWEDARIAAADAEYRKFLWLLAAYPGEMMVPWSVDMDDFWHQHILNTADYTATCQKLFGKYIDHTPEDATNAAAQHQAAYKTNERYKREFDKGQPSGTTTQDSGCSGAVYAACSSWDSGSHHHDAGSHDGGSHGGHDGGSHGGHACSSGGHSCSSGSHGCGGHGCGSSCGSSCSSGCGGGGCGGS